jgi:hypothetical protein
MLFNIPQTAENCKINTSNSIAYFYGTPCGIAFEILSASTLQKDAFPAASGWLKASFAPVI